MHFWSGTAGPLLYAHRGASRELPENSLPAFRRALELGADVLELDVHPSRDGVFVVSHDPTAERTCGVPRRLADCTWSEISSFSADGVGLARFEDVLDEFPGVALNVDVKSATESELERLLRVISSRDAEGRVLLTSFAFRSVQRIRRAGYAGAIGLSQLDVVRLRFSPEALSRYFPLAGVRVQIPVRAGPVDLSRPSFIAKCQRLGLRVDYWVINEPTEAERLLELGADGLISDDLRAIAPVFRRSPHSSAWRERHTGG